MNITTNIVDTFAIPEEFAKELSANLTLSSIKKSLLVELVGVDSVKCEVIERELIELEDKIAAQKDKVTREYVPEKFQDVRYSWGYDGFAVAGCKVNVYTT